jgi:hypothetical protein
VRDGEWRPVEDAHQVPGAVIRAFKGSGSTFQAVHDESARLLTPAIFALAGDDNRLLEELQENRALDLWSLLDPWDYEDAVGLFLQVQRGFRIPPSFCHDKNTRDFEYFLLHPTDSSQRKVAVQVKSGQGSGYTWTELEERAKEAKCDKLFIFHRGDNKGATDFTEILDPSDIEQFLIDQSNWPILTPRIQFCLELCGMRSKS